MALRYIIIGSGVASIAAIEAIRSLDTHSEILLIGDEAAGYYSRPGLAYYLTGEIGEQHLTPLSQKEFASMNVRRIHARVTRIFPAHCLVELHNNQTLSYDRLLIATGARAATTKLPGVNLDGVVKLDSLDDARRIIKLAKRGRAAVVVGGGITALELVEGFRARGMRTHYFLRGKRYWKNVLDETESHIVEERLKDEGVKIHYQTEVEEIVGKRGKVVGVVTKDGKRIKCKVIAIAIGIRPRKELAEEAGLQVDRGILVDDHLRTSDEHIYAAGDVAQVYDPYTGKSVLDSLWGPARNQGYAAGLNMAGKTTPYIKTMSFNVTRLAGLTTTIIGTVGRGSDDDLVNIARGDSETWRQLPDAIAAQSDFDVNRIRILVSERTIIGAIVMGDQTLSKPLHHIVSNQVDITTIREYLIQPGAPLGDILADFWTKLTTRQTYANQTQQP